MCRKIFSPRRNRDFNPLTPMHNRRNVFDENLARSRPANNLSWSSPNFAAGRGHKSVGKIHIKEHHLKSAELAKSSWKSRKRWHPKTPSDQRTNAWAIQPHNPQTLKEGQPQNSLLIPHYRNVPSKNSSLMKAQKQAIVWLLRSNFFKLETAS